MHTYGLFEPMPLRRRLVEPRSGRLYRLTLSACDLETESPARQSWGTALPRASCGSGLSALSLPGVKTDSN